MLKWKSLYVKWKLNEEKHKWINLYLRDSEWQHFMNIDLLMHGVISK